MRKKLTTFMVLMALAVTALCGCSGNEEKPPVFSHTTNIAENFSSSPISANDIFEPVEEKPAVKTKSESREEIVAGVLTAFCNNDEETYSIYKLSCSNNGKTPLSKEYNTFYEKLDEQGKDWENISFSPSDFEVVYAEVEEGGKVKESGKHWYCFYKNSLDENGKCLALTVFFDNFNYSEKSYSLYAIGATTYSYYKDGEFSESEVTHKRTTYYQGDLSAYITE